MALVTKNDVTQIFAIQAPSIDLPPTFANYPRGWDTARSNNGKPTIKQFNYIQQRTDQNVLWIHQNGGALPYDAAMEYAEGAVVVKDGELHKKQGASWVSAANKGYNLDYFVAGKSYPLHAEIMLENGNIVKSTVANNTNDPNVDMAGWVSDTNVVTVSTFDELKIQNAYDGQIAIVKCGAFSSNPALNVSYVFKSGDTTTPNSFAVIADNLGSGRWIASFPNRELNARFVGYFADGITNNLTLHHQVTLWLHVNPNHTLVFEGGTFVFDPAEYNPLFGYFSITSNTDYRIEKTARLKPTRLNNSYFSFMESYPLLSKHVNCKIYGGGYFDMSEIGIMESDYLSGRKIIHHESCDNFKLKGMNVVGDGDLSHIWTCGGDSSNVEIDDNYFEIPVSDNPLSKNTDFTALYSQAVGIKIRRNKFVAKTTRAKIIATAFEAHSKNSEFVDNELIDMGVAVYPAAHEQNDISDLIIRGNYGTIYNSFCFFWKKGGECFCNDTIIEDNHFREARFLTQTELDAIAFTGRPTECIWFGFVDTENPKGTPFTTNNILIQNNSFIANLENTRYADTPLFQMSSNPPANITCVNNVLKVKRIFNWAYDSTTISTTLNKFILRDNTYDYNYVANNKPYIDVIAYEMYRTIIDVSKDFNDLYGSRKIIPLTKLTLTGTGSYLNIIKEGMGNSALFAPISIPPTFMHISNGNNGEFRIAKDITIPARASAGAAVVFVALPNFGSGSLELIYSSLYNGYSGLSFGVLPTFLTKTDGFTDNFYGVGCFVASSVSQLKYTTEFYFRSKSMR